PCPEKPIEARRLFLCHARLPSLELQRPSTQLIPTYFGILMEGVPGVWRSIDMSAGEDSPDYTFEAFAQHDFYRVVNSHLVDATLQIRSRIPQLPIRRAVDLACGTGAVTQLLVDGLR